MRPVASVRSVSPKAWRLRFAFGVLGTLAAVVFARAFYLQVLDTEFLSTQGDKRFLRSVTLEANRGAIRDRRGEPLALSAPVDSVWADPQGLLSAPEYLPALAKLLGWSADGLRKFLDSHSDREFVYLNRQIDPDVASRFLALKAPGLSTRREYRRYYPAGEVAAHVVGFCNIDGQGQEGVEAAADKSLRGAEGSEKVIRDRAGRIVEDVSTRRDAAPGSDVVLTIDLRLQYIAYRELKSAVQQHHATGGEIVVADPRTGEILAMASQPGYNPNRDEDRDSAGLRNRVVTDHFEPGSTIKPLLISQAFELGAVSERTQIDTSPGTFKVGTLIVHDVHPLGQVDLARLLAKSSNIGAAKVGLSMGAQSVYAGYRRFGIDEPVNVGLPGEVDSVLRPWTKWGEIGTATASYGYGISLNALQLLRAYSAIANGGLMPSLTILKNKPLIPPQRVISQRSADEVRSLLEGVVSIDGTASRAAVNGYRVAGKTGTVRMTEGRHYADHEYRSLFVGMLPASHPRLVALIMIDHPTGIDYYGGSVAGPVFASLMRDAARLLQIPPDAPIVPIPPVPVPAQPVRPIRTATAHRADPRA